MNESSGGDRMKTLKLAAPVIALIIVLMLWFMSVPPEQPGKTRTGARPVILYYYDSLRDRDEDGNIRCSREGLVPTARVIPKTDTPIEDTVGLLIRGELTAEDRARGITTEFPLEGLTFEGAALENGVLTLLFSDPMNKTGGGACRVGILWFQIEATALQFPDVREVRFAPPELFQP